MHFASTARPLLSRLFALLAGLALLPGCDEQRAAKLEEGLSSEADVRREFGEPTQIVERADGSKLMAYPRQPEGWTNVEIVIGADGKMASLRQLLTPANFAKVQPGMAQGEVRQLLGRHARVLTYATRPGVQVWRWQFMSGQDKKVFDVSFDDQGRVLTAAVGDDERQTMPGG